MAAKFFAGCCDRHLHSPLKPLTLEPLTPDQLDAVVELDRQCLGGLWPLSGYQREIESPNSDLWVLRYQQRLIGLGCLWSILEEGHITLLGIDPEFQGQGLGQFLLCSLLQAAHRRQLQWATLEVRASNHRALSLYQKLGFQPLGERRGYYGDGENAVILWNKQLREADFLEKLTQFATQACDRLRQHHWTLDPPFPQPPFSSTC